MLRIAKRRGYIIQHVAGFVWTGSKWASDKKKAMIYSSMASLPSFIPGHGRESKYSLYLAQVKRGGTSFGTYHPYHGEVKKGKNRKTRRAPHAYVKSAEDLNLMLGGK